MNQPRAIHSEQPLDEPDVKMVCKRIWLNYFSNMWEKFNDQNPQLSGERPTINKLVARITRSMSYYDKQLTGVLRWWLGSRELSDFSYSLDSLNRTYLASFVATALRRPYAEIQGYMAELEGDAEIDAHYRRIIGPRLGPVDVASFQPGRRLGWYAVVRALKPKTIVETGVCLGVGSITLTAALLRNRAEGHPGRYLGIDIDGAAGILLSDRYAEVGRVLHGDAIDGLTRLTGPIDLFISDSDHTPGYEDREYAVVEPKLAADAVIISDSAHDSPALFLHAQRTGRDFQFFHERPADHWYPGVGLGLARRPA